LHHDTTPSIAATTCSLSWCTTLHGQTSHADDEDHRSDGLLLPGVTRHGGVASESGVEVGILQRQSDDEPWLVIESSGGVHLEITLATARRIARAVGDDDTLGPALGRGE
jgi:hypothetical protein